MQSVKILNLTLKKNNLGEIKIMNIVIVGLGVIGGSFAKALKKAGYENVFGVDVDLETLKKQKKQKS